MLNSTYHLKDAVSSISGSDSYLKDESSFCSPLEKEIFRSPSQRSPFPDVNIQELSDLPRATPVLFLFVALWRSVKDVFTGTHPRGFGFHYSLLRSADGSWQSIGGGSNVPVQFERETFLLVCKCDYKRLLSALVCRCKLFSEKLEHRPSMSSRPAWPQKYKN